MIPRNLKDFGHGSDGFDLSVEKRTM